MAQTRSRSRGPRSTSESQSGGAGGQENIYFFIPNLIGFTRVILGFGAFWTAPDDPTTTFWLYFWSCFMDALDGHAARYFGQSTKFGAVLDMVTDRCTTTLMMVQLANFWGERQGKKEWTFLFQFLIALDISSHWFHMYTTLARGGQSHKEVTNPFLRLYYSKVILFTLCACNDGFFCCLYAVFWSDGPMIPFIDMGIYRVLLYITFAPMALKQFINLVQLVEACRSLAALDVEERARSKSR